MNLLVRVLAAPVLTFNNEATCPPQSSGAVIATTSGLTMQNSSSHETNQLVPSIEKLFHYIFPYVMKKTVVTVQLEYLQWEFEPYVVPEKIAISPSLYSRLDDCHGAGNCCRVPFDLVYTDYDRSRIETYDEKSCREMFGDASAENFNKNRDDLLKTLKEVVVTIKQGDREIKTRLHVKRNLVDYELSGRKSCPYLFIGGDRYFCGVHPFKPLHCWYPHMVVRVMKDEVDGEKKTTVNIGRMQYGRNHKFGCPVIFKEIPVSEDEGLFGGKDESHLYFDKQFQSDYEKLEWTSKSAASMGMTSSDNFVVGIHEVFRNQSNVIRSCLKSPSRPQVLLWSKS